mmetsp:Transcript_15687/g.32781  ORF Transcript_15687/g.32781 Transcript_15687/m.32781 type:complete len:533 (-) Transcript_15687:151-1749(-)
MAYQIKSIRYRNEPRKILLQNENGPCPLLAAANALLLRGVITLPPECVRNGVASTDDIVNILADRAITLQQNNKTIVSHSDVDGNDHSHHEFHLNEVLGLLPNLQHGMDVNIKFTTGPSGVEYTKNLAAFDLLGVELVHGWLLDPQDVETLSVIGNKSYNELIELVILGNEAKDAVTKLEEQIEVREKLLSGSNLEGVEGSQIDGQTTKTGSATGDDASPKVGNGDAVSTELTQTGMKAEDAGNQPSESASAISQNLLQPKSLSVEEKDNLLKEIIAIKEEISDLSAKISQSEVVNSFFATTSHQLTYHGLHELHNYVKQDTIGVFFRNNHFCTITNHDGILYLLVTDLGYSNVPEIVWEKIDAIDGDTELFNEFFKMPQPREELKAADRPTISPELLLAQRNQAESDYQLALAMSRGQAPTNMDDDEGRLIDAATELSLRSYHGDPDAALKVEQGRDDRDPQIDADHQLALAWEREQQQSEHESEQLARQLQELEYARQRPGRSPPGEGGRSERVLPAPKSASASSNCTIS